MKWMIFGSKTCRQALLFCCLTVSACAYGQQKTSSLPPGLDAYVEKVLKTFHVPGLSIAVVKDGQTLLAKGYGVRKMGRDLKVDEHTLFPIASNTKAFTATALGILAERGKLQWNDKVIDHLPWFRLSDPYATREITIKDLLVHNSGLAPYAGDLLQFPVTTFTRREIVERIRHLPLVNSFRSAYAYDNVLYLAAGELIQAVSGMEWEEFIRKEILEPANMKETLHRFSLFEKQPNIAYSHIPDSKGNISVLETFFEEGMSDKSSPAGGIVSTAADMAKWMQIQLDSGRTLFRPSTAALLWHGVNPMPELNVPAWIAPSRSSLNAYALGFRVYMNRGTKVVTHGGKLDGFVSCVMMFPEINLGITILTNQESGNAYNAIIQHIADYYLKTGPFDWIAGFRKQEDAKFARFSQLEQQALGKRDSNSRPALPLEKYCGTYRDPWYGDIDITMENGALYMQFSRTPLFHGKVEHWQYETFIVRWDHREIRGDAFITFSLTPEGKIDAAKMKAVSPLTDVSLDFHDLDLKPVKRN
ncbi:serine hydrolase [Chitinophaga cymbidii]|uniref:serine hydrolase n=1 Tax=Chitinophaga cymbidii TaxID=1096750 RepID=UPI0011BF186C|nr:serine hydrolase [Chitinophaga cymbidii]